MCGIVGYIGDRPATPILIDGLRKLEYRGYDSAGIAVLSAGGTRVVRCRGKLSALEDRLSGERVPGTIGIGHTRWATHGRPSDENAHPHRCGAVSVIHNGIIENHVRLREDLAASGSTFTSETDTELFAHLVDRELRRGATDLTIAVRRALDNVRGAYAFVVMSDRDPDRLVAAKNASPMVVGLGEGETFIASDITAILGETRRMVFVDEGDIVTATRDGALFSDVTGTVRVREPKVITWSAQQAEKSGFKHFMLKEIHEQPRAIADTLAGRLDLEHDAVSLEGIDFGVRLPNRVLFLACGTSFHASLVGKYLVEGLARIKVEVDLASEWRYRDPIVDESDLVVAVSQSGETADTMAACREAKRHGAPVLAITNVVDSSIARLADWAFYTHAGPEIGVASTKAFTTQLAAMALLAIHLGERSDHLSRERRRELLGELVKIPDRMHDVLEQGPALQAIAREFGRSRGFLFLGRGAEYPIALEGALKLKEISYIHAEGYAAGEMKHGPIALVDEDLPVVVLAPNGPTYDKVVSNLAEVRARQGRVIAVATAGNREIADVADAVITVPDTLPEWQPLLTVLPLQLLAYYVADFKGTDIDQPRNLAKSVTVE